MKRAVFLLLLAVLVLACGGDDSKPLSVQGEKVYTLTGEILQRIPANNSLQIRHDKVEGYMAPMTMEFPVRGAKVDELPPNGTRVEAKLHVTPTGVWLTDVRAK